MLFQQSKRIISPKKIRNSNMSGLRLLRGATENARNEISAPSKMQVVKIRDMKMRHHTAWHENTRYKNTGKEKRDMKIRDIKMREMKIREKCDFVLGEH